MEERYSEITGNPFNTLDLDELILLHTEGAKGSRNSRELAHWYCGVGPQYEKDMKDIIKQRRQNERKHKVKKQK